MRTFDVQIALEAVAEARDKWDTARRRFNSEVQYVMARLLNEAAVNRMSVEQVAAASGLTPKRVRAMMRENGLNPKQGKGLMARNAAKTLAENAALLGVEPHEMDLTSPLAYLPMGSELKRFLETEAMQGVKEAPEDDIEARLRKAFSEPTGWLLAAEHVDEMVAHLVKALTA
jgi:hypothetical protein